MISKYEDAARPLATLAPRPLSIPMTKVEFGQDLDDYLRKQSDEELVQIKLDLQEDMVVIDAQLQPARAHAAKTHDYSNGDWYRRACGARRAKAAQYNAACAEQGRRKRERRDAHIATMSATRLASAEVKPMRPAHARFLRAFLVVAQQQLVGAAYNDIRAQARELSAQWKEDGIEGDGFDDVDDFGGTGAEADDESLTTP